MLLRPRATGLAAAAILFSLTAAGCGDDDGGPETGQSPSAGADGSSPEDGASTSPEATEDTEDTEPDADSEPTPPGTGLAADEPAVVVLPDAADPDKDRAKFAVTVDSVTPQPLSRLPDGAAPGPSDLYYVEQTYTLLEELAPSILGTNLLDHTAVVSDGQTILKFVDVAANPEGCDFATFTDSDAVGDSQTSCTAYLLPRGQTVDEVAFIDYKGDYDVVDGDPVTWAVDARG